MKIAAPLSAMFFALPVLLSGAVGAEIPKNPRAFRPLQAASVKIRVAAAEGGTTASGAEFTRQGWAAFDRKGWAEAMDCFLAALEADRSDVAAAEGLTMAVYRSGDRASAAALGEEFAQAVPWIRGMVAETLLGDLRSEIEKGRLSEVRTLVASLPHGGGVYDDVRRLVEGAASESGAESDDRVASR